MKLVPNHHSRQLHSNNMSFHFVPMGKTFFTTFSSFMSVRVLYGIAFARKTMMVARMVVACLVVF
jgi:hypothetical protein